MSNPGLPIKVEALPPPSSSPAEVDAFMVFWTSAVVAIMIVGLAWGINDLKRGSARLSWMGFGQRVSREEEPFEFWLAVGSKFAAVPVGCFMLWSAVSAFWR